MRWLLTMLRLLVMFPAIMPPADASAQYDYEKCDILSDKPGVLMKKFGGEWPWSVTTCLDDNSLAVWTIVEGDLVTVMYVTPTSDGVKIEPIGAWFDPYEVAYKELSKMTPEEFEALHQEARRHQQ